MIVLRNKWEARPISIHQAKDFVSEFHYAQGGGNVAHACHGLFYKGDSKTLHGISWWNPPPLGASKSVSEDHRAVLSLSRFCLRPDRPDNSGSFLISKSIKLLDSRWKTLLTYADTIKNHDGGLYRASNWSFNGLTRKNPVYWDPENDCMVSRKKGKYNFNKTQMIEMGYEYKGSHEKLRFLYQREKRNKLIINSRESDSLIFTNTGKILKK